MAANGRRTRAALIGVIAALVVAITVGLITYRPPRGTGTAVPSVATASTPTPTRAGKQRAVFVGDSYTRGTGASSKSKRWTTLVSMKENWEEVNLGLGGTGYWTTGGTAECGRAFCSNYANVAERVASENPDIVIVSGGQNDFAAYAEDGPAIEDMVYRTYETLRATLPNVRVIAVGPSTTADIDNRVKGLDQVVQQAAQAYQADYVSLINPPVIKPDMVAADGGHVNDAGHRAIAARVEQAVG